jgi:hypothetical protein
MSGNGQESFGAYVVRRMAEVGFEPRPGFAGHIEFSKEYADADGRRAKVYVFFDKPIMGMETLSLSNIVVSVQKNIEPTHEVIEREAPSIAKDDLFHVAEVFGDMVGYVPEQAAVTRECIKCHEHKSEFYMVSGDAVCYDCVAERKHEQRR